MSVYMIVSGATIKPSQVVRDLGSRRVDGELSTCQYSELATKMRRRISLGAVGSHKLILHMEEPGR